MSEESKMSEAQTESSTQTRGYSRAMRTIHWVMAAMMIYVIIVGFLMGNGFKVGKHYDWHRATGFLLMMLVVVRIIIAKLSKPPLPKHVDEKGLQQTAAITVHRLLYASLFIQPFLGWYATNTWGVKNIPFFFGLTLPQIAEKNREWGNQLLEYHHYLGLFITALVITHIGAALMHQFVFKDNLIKRMVKT
jgi:cytochrome b561